MGSSAVGIAAAVEQEVASVTVAPGSATINAGETQQFTATAKDENGNAVGGVNILWISSDHHVATVSQSGLATGVGGGSVTISAAGRGELGSAALTVGALPATQLTFGVQPGDVAPGDPFPVAVQVEIRDADGTLVTNARDAITLAIGTNPSSGVLSGTKTVNAVGGIATFSGLSISHPGEGYTLVASSGALTAATSGGFGIRIVPVLFVAVGSEGISGDLYTVDPATATSVGPIGFAVTGIAFSPDGTLYGVTSTGRLGGARELIRIHPATGQGTLVGPLMNALGNSTGVTDIAFVGGRLLGWGIPRGTPLDHRIVEIDVATGLMTDLGGGVQGGGGAFAIDALGRATVLIGFPVRIYDVDTTTGVQTLGATVTLANTFGGITNSAAYLKGVFYTVEGGQSQDQALLGTLDLTTGVITGVGPLPANIDAIAGRPR